MEFEFVNRFYGSDFNVPLLKSQLAVLSTTFKVRTVVKSNIVLSHWILKHVHQHELSSEILYSL